MKKIYIAYGSNIVRSQMAYRCPDAKIVGKGVLKGWRLLYRSGYATIEPEEGETVPVLVWKVSAADEARLDRYEGFPDFYFKETLKVEELLPVSGGSGPAGATEIEGMAYIMVEGHPTRLPARSYIEPILEECDTLGISTDALRKGLILSSMEN